MDSERMSLLWSDEPKLKDISWPVMSTNSKVLTGKTAKLAEVE